MMPIRLAIADDHQLFLKSVGSLIGSFPGFVVVAEALNGQKLIEKLKTLPEQPDIALLDVNMPVMNGIETAQYLFEHYPLIKVVALSMKDDDNTVINMLKAGACAYLLKDIHPDELEKSLAEIAEKGYYNADHFNIHYRRLLLKQNTEKSPAISEKEKTFLKLACSDLTYKQIANEMHLSERTIDGYRESLFEKLRVQSRTGMALEAIRQNLVTL